MVDSMCWEFYRILQMKIIENRDNSKITKHLMSLFVFVKERQFYLFFYKFDKFEIDFWACFKWLISFLVFMCNTIKTNFDKHNTFNLRMRNSQIQWIKL